MPLISFGQIHKIINKALKNHAERAKRMNQEITIECLSDVISKLDLIYQDSLMSDSFTTDEEVCLAIAFDILNTL